MGIFLKRPGRAHSFFFFFDFGGKWCSVHVRNDFVMLSFYPEDFRFNIYVLRPFKQGTERFSEDKYKIAAYIILFFLRAFCCIIYDGQISPAVSELPCMHGTIGLSMI